MARKELYRKDYRCTCFFMEQKQQEKISSVQCSAKNTFNQQDENKHGAS